MTPPTKTKTRTRKVQRQGKARRTKNVQGPRRDAYAELVAKFAPRPIHSKTQYDRTVAVMDTLSGRDESSLSRAEMDYLLMLARCVEDYDDVHYPPPDRGTPLERLTFLMEESETSHADLGRLLGNSSLASHIMLGHRQLSKTHIRILADHFKLEPGYFL